MAEDLAVALGKRFILRKDAKAIQRPDGSYNPARTREGENLGWKMTDLRDHISGAKSYGHYMVSPEGLTKLFAFDIDLTQQGYWIDLRDGEKFMEGHHDCCPREVWADASHPGREFLLIQLRTTAEAIAMKAHTLMGDFTHIAIAYSGNKGIHVYCFLEEPTPAADARFAAQNILQTMNEPDGRPTWVRTKGENFWGSANGDRRNIEIEVYPKQDDLQGKDFGNLMRLPLGVNLKSGQRSFFLDCRCGYNELRPMDPMAALGGELPWD